MTRVWFLAGQDFSVHHSIQTSSGAHPASYPVGTRVLSVGVQWPGYEANHSLPSSAEVKNAWSYISMPLYVCMVWYLVKQQGQFHLYLSISTVAVYGGVEVNHLISLTLVLDGKKTLNKESLWTYTLFRSASLH
jgi:hypothetical protein